MQWGAMDGRVGGNGMQNRNDDQYGFEASHHSQNSLSLILPLRSRSTVSFICHCLSALSPPRHCGACVTSEEGDDGDDN